ncbi:ComF family protein [Gemmatimonadota bacterium]
MLSVLRVIPALAGDVLDLFFPATCLACGNQSASASLCSSCGRVLERRRLKPRVSSAGGMPVIAAFEYDFPLNRLIPRAKRSGRPRHLHALVEPMITALQATGLSEWPQVVAPVPLHPTRRRERGWDQATYLAAEVAAGLGLPCAHRALRRRRATPPQKSAGRDERMAALEGAFVPGRSSESVQGGGPCC